MKYQKLEDNVSSLHRITFVGRKHVYLLQAIPGLEDKVPNVPDKSEYKYKRPDMYKVSNEKAKTVLGIKFKGLEQINHY